jgi:hypothetical protein
MHFKDFSASIRFSGVSAYLCDLCVNCDRDQVFNAKIRRDTQRSQKRINRLSNPLYRQSNVNLTAY